MTATFTRADYGPPFQSARYLVEAYRGDKTKALKYARRMVEGRTILGPDYWRAVLLCIPTLEK
jgi:hypothetical protein